MQRTKEILKRVKKIEIKTQNLVEGLIAGAYHSIFKGRGIEFSEVREYQLGDDVRTIDWNVTARMSYPFVKEFIEERDLTVYIVFDISASGEFGDEKSKKDMSIELAASLMFSAMRNNDNIGLALFTDKLEKFVPAKKGKKHVLKLIREMVYHEAENKGTDIEKSLVYLSKIIKKRSIIFIISDFISNDFERPVKIMKSRHDIIAININDVREKEIPDVGYIELEDEETGEQLLVDTSDPEFRKRYKGLVEKKNEKLRKDMQKLKVDVIQMETDKGFEIPLRKFFRLRERRAIR